MPGESHGWLMWGLQYQNTVSVAAYPIGFITEEMYLAVEDVKFENGRNGIRLHFTVRNVGTVPVYGYGMGVSWISH